MHDEPLPQESLSDAANGYERLAEIFIRSRSLEVGRETVREWCAELPARAEVLDLGCGFGLPISQVLIDAGVSLCAVDASPSLLRAFSARFPQVPVECARAEECLTLNRAFDGIVAWGLLFLLSAEDQRRLLARIAPALRPGGRFLFTAPREQMTWKDVMTELESRSLGSAEYASLLESSGLVVAQRAEDSGGNVYYEARRNATGPVASDDKQRTIPGRGR